MKINEQLKSTWLRNGIPERPNIKPFLTSLIITLLYIVFISLYIYISGKLAYFFSDSAESLKTIEITKGLIFTLVTGCLLFLFSYICLRKFYYKDGLILRQNKSIISSERLVVAGIFSSSICHDMNNLIQVVRVYSDMLKESENLDEEERDLILNISEASEGINNLTKRMMDAGKGYIPGEKKYENLSKVVIETVDFAKIHIKLRNCRIVCDIQPDISANINSILIARSLMNLILNAAEATGAKGEIHIILKKEDNMAILEIHDDGAGVPEDMEEKIFEPFFTSKSDGNGLGLLSLKICAQQHEAEIELKKSHLKGACFSISFPINDEKLQELSC